MNFKTYIFSLYSKTNHKKPLWAMLAEKFVEDNIDIYVTNDVSSASILFLNELIVGNEYKLNGIVSCDDDGFNKLVIPDNDRWIAFYPYPLLWYARTRLKLPSFDHTTMSSGIKMFPILQNNQMSTFLTEQFLSYRNLLWDMKQYG